MDFQMEKLAIDEFNKKIDKSEEDYKKGNVISHEEMKLFIKKLGK